MSSAAAPAPKSPEELDATLTALGLRIFGLIGCAYAHNAKCSGDRAEHDRLEGSHMKMLMREAAKLGQEYAALFRAQAEAAKPKGDKK